MNFKKLTLQEQIFYGNVNSRLGLPLDFESSSPNSLNNNNQIVLSGDSLKSDIPAKLIPVANIADYKEKIAALGLSNDGAVDYLENINSDLTNVVNKVSSTKEFKTKLSTADKQNIRKAATAYILGDAKKAKPYEATINALLFPTYIAYFAFAAPFKLDKPLIIDSAMPVILNYATINVEGEGRIDVHNVPHLDLNVGVVNTNNDSKNFTVIAKPQPYHSPAPNGANGMSGVNGQNGTPGEVLQPGGNGSPYICARRPGDGGNGGAGTNGLKGLNGVNGGNQAAFTTTLEVVNGNLIIIAGGQDGQNGGDGGTGGNGGHGGQAGTNPRPTNVCSPAKNGTNEHGGDGGHGGNGGNGGEGNVVIIHYASITGKIEQQNTSALGGKPGMGGMGGMGGSGTPNGYYGAPGTQGKKGSPAHIMMKKFDFLLSNRK